MMLTSNGRPVAVSGGAGEGDIEETVIALCRARAQAAVSRMRHAATACEADRLSPDEIEAEIVQVRLACRTASAEG